MNYICDAICNSSYLLFAVDIEILRNIRNVEDCKLLQSDVDSVQKCCLGNGMKLNVGKTTFICFTRKTSSIAFKFKLGFTHTARSQCVKGLGVLLDS
jgi:hypothetical protein